MPLSVLLHCSQQGSTWRRRKEGKKPQQARTIYTPSICSCVPLCRSLSPYRPFPETLGQSGDTCHALRCLKKGRVYGRGVYSFYSIFILLGSGSMLLSCSSPSPCRLTSIPPFFLSSPLLFSKRQLSPVRLHEYRIVSFKSKDMGAVGQAKRSSGHFSPTHPDQLLSVRNRIISAKVAVLFHSQEHSKQRERKTCRRERETEDRQQKTVCQFDADVSNCLDRFSDEFLLSVH